LSTTASKAIASAEGSHRSFVSDKGTVRPSRMKFPLRRLVKAWSRTGGQLGGELPNYTDAPPVIQLSQIIPYSVRRLVARICQWLGLHFRQRTRLVLSADQRSKNLYGEQ